MLDKMRKITLRAGAGAYATVEEALKQQQNGPGFELLVDDQPFDLGMLQEVKVHFSSMMLLPLVTITFIPKEVVLELEKAAVLAMQAKCNLPFAGPDAAPFVNEGGPKATSYLQLHLEEEEEGSGS